MRSTLRLLLLLVPSCLSPAQVFPASKIAHFLLLPNVFLNGQGPFRMIVDTGATSSTLRPAIAGAIGAIPAYRIEQITAAGSTLFPAGPIRVRTGATETDAVEMTFSPVSHPDADGILGQSWLRRHSYLLDFSRGQVVLNGPPPARAIRLPFRDSEGRPCLSATVDGQPRDLVLDSGAPALILFGPTSRFHSRALLTTNSGAVEGTLGRAELRLGSDFRRSLPAMELPPREVPGLLPASLFQAVYVPKDSTHLFLVPR